MPRARRRTRPPRVVTEPVEAAKLAGLTYVTQGRPGITRRRAGKSFTYVHRDGARVRDAETLARRAHAGLRARAATQRDHHMVISGSLLRFHFGGKSGNEHAVDIRDPRLVRIERQARAA